MSNKQKIAIGFDLGTTSVGWSIIKIGDDKKDLTILDMGVRLFDDPNSNDSNVETRREARSRRRRIHRLKIRKYELFKLLKKYQLVDNEEIFKKYISTPIYNESDNSYYLPVQLKLKGLNEELEINELILVLHNYIKHRGTLLTIDNEENEEENSKEENKQISRYDKDLLPCENQWEWFKQSGKVLGNNENAEISNEDYQKEIRKILANQKLSNNFIEEYILLFKRHRHYSQGPGSKNSFSQYGRFQKNKLGNWEWMGDASNLWDKLVGKCTYYPELPRNYRKSPITEIFNLLNDFANMRLIIDDNLNHIFLNSLQKLEMINTNDESKLTLDKMLKVINLKKNNIIGGVKGVNENKPIIEELKSCRAILSWLNNDLKLDLKLIDNLEIIEKIFDIGVKYQNNKDRFEGFKEHIYTIDLLSNLSDENIKKIAELKIWSSGTSSLSKRAQKEFITYALSEDGDSDILRNITKNQMYFFNEYINSNSTSFKASKYFPTNYFKDEIMSSTVKRTFNQATKVLNAILKNKKYANYEISNIIIEMARELNSKDEKDNIDKENKANKNRFEKLIEYHKLNNKILKGENRLKFLLWCEQGMKDIYDGEPIDFNDVLNNPNKYHIDHIIPISLSFTDAMSNKVLTKYFNNEEKGDKTPYQWLSSKGLFDEFKDRVEKTYYDIANRMQEFVPKQIKKLQSKYKNKMNNYLLYVNDPMNDLNGFVSRQLNDTRYISKLFLNNLKNFFNNSKYYSSNKPIISIVNGALTSFARNNYFSEKDYDERLLLKKREIYNHHAIDASIICFLGLNHKIQKMLNFKVQDFTCDTDSNGNKRWIKNSTGEIYYDGSNIFREINPEAKAFEKQMRDYINPDIANKFVRFSRMLVSKNNISLSNETIYSIRSYNNEQGEKINYKISKLDIMNEKTKFDDLKKYFGTNAKDKDKQELLCYRYQRDLYEKLSDIFNDENFNNSKNPFIKYMNSEYIKDELKKKNYSTDKLIIFENDKPRFLRYLRCVENVSKENVLLLKNHKNHAFLDTLNSISIILFKNNDGEIVPWFLNALNIIYDKNKHKIIPNISKKEKFCNDYNILNKDDFIVIKKGQVLINDRNLYYIIGGSPSDMKLEIKPVFLKYNKDSKKIECLGKPGARIRKSISSLIKSGFKLCNVDALGNVYNIRSFEEAFNK